MKKEQVRLKEALEGSSEKRS